MGSPASLPSECVRLGRLRGASTDQQLTAAGQAQINLALFVCPGVGEGSQCLDLPQTRSGFCSWWQWMAVPGPVLPGHGVLGSFWLWQCCSEPSPHREHAVPAMPVDAGPSLPECFLDQLFPGHTLGNLISSHICILKYKYGKIETFP